MFFLEDSVHLEVSFSRSLLFSSLDSKWAHLVCCEEIFNSGLELLTPLWQTVLGIHCSATVSTARRGCTLLDNCLQLFGDGAHCSATAHNCSMTHYSGRTMGWSAQLWFAPARTSSRRRCTMGTRRLRTSCGGYDPGYPQQTTWVAPSGVAQPTRQSLARHGSTWHLPQRHREDILKIL